MGFCQWVMRLYGVLWSLPDYFCWSFLVLFADWWFISVVRRRKDVDSTWIHSALYSPPAVLSLSVFLSASFPFAPSVHVFSSLILSASICFLSPTFSRLILPLLCPILHFCKKEYGSFNVIENLMNTWENSEVVGISKWKTALLLGWPLTSHHNP